MRRTLMLTATHAFALVVGFALGIYLLPVLTAPPSPERAMLEAMAEDARYRGEFTRDLRGSDLLHWGEGVVSLTSTQIVHQGRLAPGPDYKLYLAKEFVEHEDEFLPVKPTAQLIGDVDTFNGFLLDLPHGIDVGDYTTVLVWCEAFGEFITAARYR